MKLAFPPETKYIYHDDGSYEMDYSDYPHVTRHTRAGKNGKDLYCPHCAHRVHVYHFSWDALVCGGCKRNNKYNPKAMDTDSEIPKSDWLLQAPDWSMTLYNINSMMID